MEKEPLTSSLEPGTLNTATSQKLEDNDKEETLEEARKHHAECVKKHTEPKDKLEHLIDLFESCRRLISPTPQQAPSTTPELTPEEEQRLWKEHLTYRRGEEAWQRREEAELLQQRQDPRLEAILTRGSCHGYGPQEDDRKLLQRLGTDPYFWFAIHLRKRRERRERSLRLVKAVGWVTIFAVFAWFGYWVTERFFGC
jgi:hypothetical protein